LVLAKDKVTQCKPMCTAH